MFSKNPTKSYTRDYLEKIDKLKTEMNEADAILIGAGAGLSSSAGFAYAGERFNNHFGDFSAKYGLKDMYSGGFYSFETPEEHWAYWSRLIYFNRYDTKPPKVYRDLLQSVKDKDYFILTTNVDHQFQLAGFDKKKLFYTQGDYGLFQCSTPCHSKTYENKDTIYRMVFEQENMKIPQKLLPKCPICHEPMTMNLRSDNRFVEDDGWHAAADRYAEFVENHQNDRILYLELGVGYNTPGIIKYPFWQMTAQNPKAILVSINLENSDGPQQIKQQSIFIDSDIGDVIEML